MLFFYLIMSLELILFGLLCLGDMNNFKTSKIIRIETLTPYQDSLSSNANVIFLFFSLCNILLTYLCLYLGYHGEKLFLGWNITFCTYFFLLHSFYWLSSNYSSIKNNEANIYICSVINMDYKKQLKKLKYIQFIQTLLFICYICFAISTIIICNRKYIVGEASKPFKEKIIQNLDNELNLLEDKIFVVSKIDVDISVSKFKLADSTYYYYPEYDVDLSVYSDQIDDFYIDATSSDEGATRLITRLEPIRDILNYPSINNYIDIELYHKNTEVSLNYYFLSHNNAMITGNEHTYNVICGFHETKLYIDNNLIYSLEK